MALIYRTSSAANVGPETIKNSALTYEEGDGNFAYLLTNMSGSSISITGDTTLTGQLQLDGNVFLPQLTSASQNNILTYNASSGRIHYTSSTSIVTVPNLQQVTDVGSTTTSNLVLTGSGNTRAVITKDFIISQNTATGTSVFLEPGGTLGLDNGSVESYLANTNVTTPLVTLEFPNQSGTIAVVSDTGSLIATASVSNNTITFTKGDGSTFPVTINTGSATTTPTASLLTTASVSLNTITFTKGDGSTFPITVNTGSGVSATPGGSNTHIQFNSGSTFSGSASFRFISASQSLEQGFNTQAIRNFSHAEGNQTIAIGGYSHAEGYNTRTIGDNSHAEGYNTVTGYRSEFIDSTMTGNSITFTYPGDYRQYFPSESIVIVLADGFEYVFSDIISTTPTFDGTYTTLTFLNNSDVYIGYIANTYGFGAGAHAEGRFTVASGESAHSEGYQTIAIGDYSHAEGNDTQAIGDYSHAEGVSSEALGVGSHAEGLSTNTGATLAWSASIQFQYVTMSAVHGNVSSDFNIGDRLYIYRTSGIVGQIDATRIVTESVYNVSTGNTILGLSTSAGGTRREAYIGNVNVDPNSWTGGGSFVIPGIYAHSEGLSTNAIGQASHAEGNLSTAYGLYSHAEGFDTKALGAYSHAEGIGAQAVGPYSHAEGFNTLASAASSHAEGWGTSAAGLYQSVIGQYNVSSSAQSAFIIGNGVDDSNRSNLLFAEGTQVQITGSLNISGSARIENVLTLPYQHPLPSAPATGSIALSGSGATFVGMFVWTGTWTQI